MKLDELAQGDAQRLLLRSLRKALAEDRCAAVLLAALESADTETLPSDPQELLRFARTHLVPPLTQEVGPNLTIAIVDEFSTGTTPDESVKDHRGPSKSSRGPVESASAAHEAVTAPPPARAPRFQGESAARLPFAKLRKSAAHLVRTASTRIRSVISAAKNPLFTSHHGPRPAVYLVHANRLQRASLARALVSARFDVTVFEATPEVLPAAANPTDPIILITDMGEDGFESKLRTLMACSPAIRIVVWTDIEPAVAEHALVRAGAKKFVVLSKTGAEVELVDAARRLLR